MKETKKFFDTNRLNKGYSKTLANKQNDVEASSNRYRHVLPPIDIMAEYEEMSPGTTNKIFDMAQKEQNHRHSMDLLNIEKHARATKMGRACSLALVTIISIAVLVLAFGEHYMIASIFSVAAFAGIGTVSFIQSGKRFNNKVFHKNFDHKNRVHNYKARSINR